MINVLFEYSENTGQMDLMSHQVIELNTSTATTANIIPLNIPGSMGAADGSISLIR
ncbi:hypothetical protein [Mucilaginibacter sp.]|uniref:hypothetical protein n=1 Tax=Mucilaginibacter sp. TaxID=1882438 RepID=UPI00260B9BD3|nr:hypothetical protein [Mucilaginibacter sp.]MDB5030546.1 hypothetical protein [Mucilaginibacter sp.]